MLLMLALKEIWNKYAWLRSFLPRHKEVLEFRQKFPVIAIRTLQTKNTLEFAQLLQSNFNHAAIYLKT